MRKWLFVLALVIWGLFILNIQTVSNMAGFYTAPHFVERPSYMPDTSDLMAQARSIRQHVYTYFPTPDHPLVRNIDRTKVLAARELMYANAQENMFMTNMLSCEADTFFSNEREILTLLMELSCLVNIDMPEGNIYGDIRVITYPKGTAGYVRETGYITCNGELKKIAIQAINDLLRSDMLFAEATSASTFCRDNEVRFSMMLAQQNLQSGDIMAELGNYALASRKALSCMCQ